MKILSKLLIILLIFSLTACGKAEDPPKEEVTVLKNGKINADIIKDIEAVDDKVIEAIEKNDTKLAEETVGKKLAPNILDFNETIGKIKKIKSKDKFYLSFEGEPQKGSVVSEKINDNCFINLQLNFNEQVYSVTELTTGKIKYSIATIYYKSNDEWKLNDIKYAKYKIDGLTAIDFYNKSEKDNELMKVINLFNAKKLAVDNNDVYKFLKQSEIEKTYNSTVTNYYEKNPLPIKFDLEETDVFSITDIGSTFSVKYGVILSLNIYTSTYLDNTELIEKNVETVNKDIKKTLPDIDGEFKYIEYIISNKEDSSEAADTDQLSIIKKLDKKKKKDKEKKD